MARTKVICTVGPASRSSETLEQLIQAGMNVARLNFSYGTQSEHSEVIQKIRHIAERFGRPVAILQDLAGLKIRVGEIESGSITLESGAPFILTNRRVLGNAQEVSITYSNLAKEVQPGDSLLLSDGALELEVEETTDRDIVCRVLVGGPLASHKGINLPTRSIPGAALTGKDREDLAFGIEQKVDYVALSFVRSVSDVMEAKRFIEERRNSIPIIAKIERREAVMNMDEIMEVVDGIMVARGDLGVETPLQKIPLVQKRLIEHSNRRAKPVITATHMLRSMVDNPHPTRAEVSDVANAILDGTDAVMLSEETAVGKYPVQAVELMIQIAEDIEADFQSQLWMKRFEPKNGESLPEAVAYAACKLADKIKAAAIITCTQSGSTARLVARYRPGCAIFAVTPQRHTYCRLPLVWGVVPLLIEDVRNTDDMVEKALSAVSKARLLQRGETVVITAGVPVGVPGTTNLIKAEKLA
jgi:pyruvate kinase